MPVAIISKKTLVPNQIHMIAAAAASAPNKADMPKISGRDEGATADCTGLDMPIS